MPPKVSKFVSVSLPRDLIDKISISLNEHPDDEITSVAQYVRNSV